MTTRYEAYNEMTFEAYCKTAISRSVLKERLRKAEQGKREQPLSIVTNAMLYGLSCEDTGIEQTIRWYLENREWWEHIISGEYSNYFQKMYGERL